MIASAGTGSGFGGLARYLVSGGRDGEAGRVAWVETYNLMTQDPEKAARLMQATAAQNPRVEKPVYHLSVSFAPEDRPSEEQMREVAGRVLRELGLGEHQAVAVAHRDTGHAHVHLMVNRVHPETLRAWRTGHDFRRIEEVLRRAEREMGLRVVPGRHERVEGREVPGRRELTKGEVRERERTGEAVWSERAREALAGEFRAARSWAELEHRLRRHGYRLRERGRGLVVTDARGRQAVKASRIARSASAHRLAERFGMSYPEYRSRRAELVAESRRLAAVQRAQARLQARVGRAVRVGSFLRRPTPGKAVRLLPIEQQVAKTAVRFGLDGLSFALRPGPLKAVRLAMAAAREVSRELER